MTAEEHPRDRMAIAIMNAQEELYDFAMSIVH
jgi:hypothetical protein